MSMRPGAWSCVHREAAEARDCMSGYASGAGSCCMPPHVCATARPCDKREKRHSSMYHVRKRSFLLPAASIRRPPTHMLKGSADRGQFLLPWPVLEVNLKQRGDAWMAGWLECMDGWNGFPSWTPPSHSLLHIQGARLASCLEGKSLQDKIRPPSYPRHLRLDSFSPHHTWTLVMAL